MVKYVFYTYKNLHLFFIPLRLCSLYELLSYMFFVTKQKAIKLTTYLTH